MTRIITKGFLRILDRRRHFSAARSSGIFTSKACARSGDFSVDAIRNSGVINFSSATTSRCSRSLARLDIGTQRRWYVIPECTFTFNHSVHDDHPLSEYISTCLSSEDRPQDSPIDTDVSLYFIGTGGSCPTKDRICSSTLLRLGPQSFLFDVSEGAQRQLMFTRMTLKDINKIFITHMHADHILGLPGMLLFLNQVSLMRKLNAIGNTEPTTIDIYGPPGLFNYIAMTLELSRTGKLVSSFVVHELMGSDEDRQVSSIGRDARHSYFPEFRRSNLTRKAIPRNDDGTWTIETPSVKNPLDRQDDRSQGFHIFAAEIEHVHRVPTFGYTVKEQDPEFRIDADKARACGIAPSRKYRLLKGGHSVMSDDGTRMVHPEEVLTNEVRRKARKFAFVGDNSKFSPAMIKLCQDCDVLVHEATVHDDSVNEAIRRGHSTPGMAGQVAQEVNAQVLVLNHISNKFWTDDELSEIVTAAEKTNRGVSSVVVAHDFMEMKVPLHGFDLTRNDEIEESLGDTARTAEGA